MNAILNTLSPSATNMIRMDHTHVLSTFHKYKIGSDPETKRALVNMACLSLEVHAQIEEEIFYPAMRAVASDSTIVAKNISEHDEMRRLIARLRGMEPTDSSYDQTFMDLMRDVLHHVADEETTLLPDAERLLGDRLDTLGAEMTRRRMELSKPRAGEMMFDTMRAAPATSMLVAAGALLAGTYIYRRAFRHHA